MDDKYYIYEYIRLDTNEPFYIGKGHGRRWKDLHHRNQWFKNIINQCEVAVNILFTSTNEQLVYDVECWYINEYKYVMGYNLVNISDGGEGFESGENHPMYGKSPSEETRRKLSESRKGKYCGVNNHFYGKTHTEEARKKISESAKGRVSPMKGRTGELSSCYGREHSVEEKEKILTSQPTRKEIYCIELDMLFLSVSQAEKYMKETYGIVFSRRTLVDKLKKENIVHYKEIVINDIMTKLHWQYA